MAKVLYPLVFNFRLCRTNVKLFNQVTFYISKFYLNNNTFPLNYSCRNSSSMDTNISDKNIFQGKIDRYQGVTVHSINEKCSNIDEFSKKLKDSIETWKLNGNRGIWFRIHLDHTDWIPILVKNGFKFHHAREEFVMMYLWLPNNEESNIPAFAHTMLGVGAVVVNDKNQLLVVVEKYRILNTLFYKLPGGHIEPGEDIVDAAVREAYEETGINTEFQSLLTLRHTHNRMFGCSDIYFVVSLKPMSEKISKCDREIADCIWMNIEEFLNHPNVHELNRYFVNKYLEYNELNINVPCKKGFFAPLNINYATFAFTKEESRDDLKINDEHVKAEKNLTVNQDIKKKIK